MPFPRQGCGEMRKSSIRYDIHGDSTKHQCQVWKGVWHHCHVGTSPPGLLPHARGASPETPVAGGWWPGLAICFCMAEWHHVPCTPVQWGACQCYDRQYAQHEHLWPAPLVVSTKIIATWGLGDMSRRAKWGAQDTAVHLSGATTLECCHHGWTCPPLIEVDLGSIQPNSVTTAIQDPTTTLVLPPLWLPLLNLLMTLLWPSTSSSRGALEQLQWASPIILTLSPSTVCWRGSHHQWPWGLCPQMKK